MIPITSRIGAVALAAIVSLPSLHASLTVDFQDVSTSIPPAQSYVNGGAYFNGRPPGGIDQGNSIDGSFISGGATFQNTFTANFGFEFWDGFAYSSTTDVTTPGFTNQYSAYSLTNPDGSNSTGNNTYGVGYYSAFDGRFPTITLPTGWDTPVSIRIANTTYAALYVLSEFSGPSDDPGDPFEGNYLLLTIQGLDDGGDVLNSVDFLLADYRTAIPFVLDDWANVDLTSLGSGISALRFTFGSNDVSGFGINVPTYMAVDDLVLVPEPGTFVFLSLAGFVALLQRRRKS